MRLQGIEAYFNPDDGTVTLKRECPECHKEMKLVKVATEWQKGKAALEKGALVQHAFPSWTSNEREFLLTGLCHDCWDKLFSDDKG